MYSIYDSLIASIVQHKRVDENNLRKIESNTQKKRSNFPRQLIADNIIDDDELLMISRTLSHCPVVDLRSLTISPELINHVDEAMVHRYTMLPIFERSGRLFLATFDPFNKTGLDAFKFTHDYASIEPVLASVYELEQVIGEIFSQRNDIDSLLLADELSEGQKQQELNELSRLLMGGTELDEAPVVKYVSEILLDAIRTGASDLHFEPYENTFRVRFRKDGILREVSKPPSNITHRITSRLKVISGMNIAEKRVPQDGRIQLSVSDATVIDFRVNTLPTIWGEKVVLRVLEGSAAKLNIDALGFSPTQQQLFIESIQKPQGLILVTGPTGSGKTVSLYTGLNILNQPAVNISTAEDPVEITLPGINQVNISPKQGMTFASALRAFLRQDPDIIMVGEVRDVETAEIAIKAAQTGHLVMSTLHTNDVPQTLTRLSNMGIAPYNIAASVLLIMAQRLVRKLCSHCKTPDANWSVEQLVEIGLDPQQAEQVTLFKANGCDRCGGQGYEGRIGIYQVVKITPKLSEMIMADVTSIEFTHQCEKEGFKDLRQAGLDKAVQGITSLSEVLRMTME